MTRAVLCLLVSVLAVAVGLSTGAVQSRNHARAASLDASKRECDVLESRIQILEAETMRQRYSLRYAYGDPDDASGRAVLPEH